MFVTPKPLHKKFLERFKEYSQKNLEDIIGETFLKG
jgi:hypothetical protein